MFGCERAADRPPNQLSTFSMVTGCSTPMHTPTRPPSGYGARPRPACEGSRRRRSSGSGRRVPLCRRSSPIMSGTVSGPVVVERGNPNPSRPSRWPPRDLRPGWGMPHPGRSAKLHQLRGRQHPRFKCRVIRSRPPSRPPPTVRHRSNSRSAGLASSTSCRLRTIRLVLRSQLRSFWRPLS
jgi:hypothetical protein